MAVIKPNYEDGVLQGDITEEQMLQSINKVTTSGNGGGKVITTGAFADTVTVKAGASNYAIKAGEGKNVINTENGTSILSIEGGSGVDSITNNDEVIGDIIAGAGADKINIKGKVGGTVTALGLGNNTVNIMDKVYGYVQTGAGADKITVYDDSHVNQYIDAGEGNNTIVVHNNKGTDNATVDMVKTGAGNDKITIGTYGVVNSIEAGAGNNTITINGKVAEQVSALGGNDKITVGGTGNIDSINAGEGNNTITVKGTVNSIATGAGVDKITVSNANSVADIESGAGNDVINVTAGQKVNIDAGAGSDKITVDWTKTSGDMTIVADAAGLGNDAITIKGLKTTQFESVVKVGDDLKITAVDGRVLTIKNWAADTINAITFGDGKKTKDYLNTSADLINGKAEATDSKETIKLDGNLLTVGKYKYTVPISKFSADNPFVIKALAGDDTITINNASNYKVELGAGKDKVTIDWKTSKNIILVAGDAVTGNESITVKNGKFSDFAATIDEQGDLSLVGADGYLKIENFAANSVKEITFADGKVSADFIRSLQNDEVVGTNKADKIIVDGKKGSLGKVGFNINNVDVVSGGAGNDTITVSRTDNVILKGNLGNDKYIVDWANCHGVIIENDNNGGVNGLAKQEKDTLTINGLAYANVIFYAEEYKGAKALVISDGEKSLLVSNWEDNKLSSIKFADKTIKGTDIGKDKKLFARENIYSGTNAADEIVVDASNRSVYVDGLAGDDSIKVIHGSEHEIFGGVGSDTITLEEVKSCKVDAGEGNNIIVVNGISSNYVSGVSQGTIISGCGADEITFNKGGFYRVKTGGGNDVVTINDGSHVIYTEAGDDIIDVTSSKASYVNAGAGNDIITLGGYGSNTKIVGGDGNDIITVNNYGQNMIEGGKGNDTYNISSTYSEIVIDNSTAGSGDYDVLNITGHSYDIDDLIYDQKRDILIADYIVVKGFSKLSKINLVSPYGYKESYTSKEVINMAYKFGLSEVGAAINEYNSDINTVISKGITTNDLAIGIGYSGK